MFSKVSKSMGEVSSNDVMEETVKDTMKVRIGLFLFYWFELCSSI